MGSENIRFIALDMDGTILDDEYRISEAVSRTLGSCKALGKKIIISTGRVRSSAAKHVEGKIQVDGFVCSNGADVYLGGFEPILEKHMDESLSRGLVQLSRRHESHFHAFIGDTWYYETERPYTAFYARRTGLEGIKLDFDSLRVLAFTKVLFIDDHERLLPIESELRSSYGGRVQIMYSSPKMLEVVVQGVSKASGLEACVRALGGSLSETMAFGDAENDEDMILAVGIGVAMGNASPDLKAKADFVAPGVDEDGVAVFLKDYFAI
ncbi:MAG TPA: HAD family hydrolase [Rectinemataceae bacterium]